MTLSLQEVSDRLEIEELLVRYCYAVDDRDWAAYRNIFTSDAVLDDTVTGGIRSGVEEHVTYLQRALSKILISQHAISTVLIDVRGDEASARLHCSCPMVVDIGEGKRHVFFQGLWYRDRVVRTPEGWRISELVEEGYWNHNLPEGFRFWPLFTSDEPLSVFGWAAEDDDFPCGGDSEAAFLTDAVQESAPAGPVLVF